MEPYQAGFTNSDFEDMLTRIQSLPKQEHIIYMGYKLAWEVKGKPKRTLIKRGKGKLRLKFVSDYR